MPFFSLDTDAAERYLLSIPLLSLAEDVSSWPPKDVSINSPSKDWTDLDAQKTEVLLDGSLRDAAARTIHGRRCASIDVLAATNFLNSLEVDSIWPRNSRSGQATAITLSKQELGLENIHFVESWQERADLEQLKPGLIRKGLVGGRIILSARNSWTCISSTRAFTAALQEAGSASELREVRKLKTTAATRQGFTFRNLRCVRRLFHFPEATDLEVTGTSYADLLLPHKLGQYNPDSLDDQSLRQGKHHTVMHLESYHVSVIPFVRPKRLKEELNGQFRASHPQIHPSITLSKLRNLQKDLREITLAVPELDIACVAIGWAYFEKLVLSDRVRKANRKLLAGACLVLAWKFHQQVDQRDRDDLFMRLAACIRRLDRKDQLSLSALQDAQLQVFVWLEFSLHIPRSEVLPHLQRMMKDLGILPLDYYGTDEEAQSGVELPGD